MRGSLSSVFFEKQEVFMNVVFRNKVQNMAAARNSFLSLRMVYDNMLQTRLVVGTAGL
jgi:hypothetical protein